MITRPRINISIHVQTMKIFSTNSRVHHFQPFQFKHEGQETDQTLELLSNNFRDTALTSYVVFSNIHYHGFRDGVWINTH